MNSKNDELYRLIHNPLKPTASSRNHSGAETSRGSIPDSGAVKPSTGGAESPVWDPALEVLRQTGMEGLDMTPRWELNRAVSDPTVTFVSVILHVLIYATSFCIFAVSGGVCFV